MAIHRLSGAVWLWIAVQLPTDQVGVFVVVVGVVIDGPEHGADGGWVAGGLAQLVRRARGRLAGKDVVHCLTYEGGRVVAGEEADSDLVRRHGWEELPRIAADVEAVQQQVGH